MIEEYLRLKRIQSNLLNQYSKADQEEKKIIKKEFLKVDDQMRKIYRNLPKGIKKQI